MSTQERIEKRREYLKKKGAAYTKAGLASLLAVPLCSLAVLFLIGAVLTLFACLFISQTERAFAFIGFCAVGSFCFGVPGVAFVRTARMAHLQAQQLPYVPPVIADTLPAEEVLVRAAQEPTQEQSQVLLRGAQGSQDSAEQELLRGSSQELERT